MFNKKLSCFLICLPLIFASSIGLAKDLEVSINLLTIEALKTSERLGDEVYFSVTEYSSKSTPKLFRVPMFPLHWLSRELPQVKNVNLWTGELKEEESVLLILSLIEQDLEPWNVDDHLGSVQVKLANKKGKIVAQWGQPKFSDQPKVEQPDTKVPKFIMFGEASKYVTVFQVETAAKKK